MPEESLRFGGRIIHNSRYLKNPESMLILLKGAKLEAPFRSII
jgi:hypothetical protein